jgi:DMSO/TMAO reductase YedYZ molybdopterin-dependent catalytic subunit
MQIHVGAALMAIPLAIWHVVARRVRPRRTDISRRNLLRAGTVVGGSTLAYLAIEGALAPALLPGGSRRFTGSFENGSFHPEDMPVTQWFNDVVPQIDGDAWRLVVRAGTQRVVTRDELSNFQDTVRATIDCTGGWYAHQDWTGVRLDRLLDGGTGNSVLVVSATGYSRRFPLADAPSLLLATRVGGRALSAGHGFPARLVAPGRRGFWWVKWVTRVEVDDRPWWLQLPFPVT